LKNPNVPLISLSDTSDYFTTSVTPKTFMNPANLKTIFESYADKDFSTLIKRFNFINETQINAMMGYFKQMLNN
jgi:hypothetical protein